jgi:site-specific DNA-methyltransferase (adenine-specific)
VVLPLTDNGHRHEVRGEILMEENNVTLAFEQLIEAVQTIQNDDKISFYEALIKNAEVILNEEAKNDETISSLDLTNEEWRRVLQMLILKGGQTEPLQANHQLTPDGIAILVVYLIDSLYNDKKDLAILDNAAGFSNLLLTVMTNLEMAGRIVSGIAVENDDLLAQISMLHAELTNQDVAVFHQDGLLPVPKKSDVAIADFPIGYYPVAERAAKFKMYAGTEDLTYAHHLLLEAAMKEIVPNGYGIFLLPAKLLDTPQAELMKKYIENDVYLQAIIGLPESLFKSSIHKSIFIFQNRSSSTKQEKIFAMNLSSLTNPNVLKNFFKEFTAWQKSR